METRRPRNNRTRLPSHARPKKYARIAVNEAVFGDLSGYTGYMRENFRSEPTGNQDFDNDLVALKVSRREDGILTQSGRMLRFA